MSNEHPVSFKGRTVLAVLGGRKHQMRRVITQANSLINERPVQDTEWAELDLSIARVDVVPDSAKNPGTYLQMTNERDGTVHSIRSLIQKGDRLWVKEKWRVSPEGEESDTPVLYEAGCKEGEGDDAGDPTWNPASKMPHLYSRVKLEVTSIRAEHANDISEEDVQAEGVERLESDKYFKDAFKRLWDAANAKRGPGFGFDFGPWVWVICFKVVGDTE